MGRLYALICAVTGTPGRRNIDQVPESGSGLSADQIAQLRLSYGADTPVLTQHVHAVVSLLHGDFGLSVQTGVPVSDLLSENLPSTLLLALLGLIVATILAFVLAALPHFCRRLAGCVRRCNRCHHCLFRCRLSGSVSC
jgi:ABC-type dipeptide/oligopeptide/nickel transport system permease component